MATTQSVNQLAGKYGGLKRHGHPSSDAQRDLAAEMIAAYAAKIVAEAPPLTDTQRDRIASILRIGGEPAASPDRADG